MQRPFQSFVHMLIIGTMLISHLFGMLEPPIAAAVVPREAPTAAQPTNYPVIDTLTTDWGLPFGDGQCQILWIPPANDTVIEARTMRDLVSRVVYDSYYWRYADGAQVRLYQNVDHPDQIWVNIAGSTVNYPGFGDMGVFNGDINDNFENGTSQNNINSDYARMMRKIIQYAIPSQGLTNKRIMITGHSQGGNTGQLVALEAFLNNPNMQAQYPEAWESASIQVQSESGITITLKHNFPQDMLGTAFGTALAQANTVVEGGVIVASRPHWLAHKINVLKGDTPFLTFLSEATDPVPALFTHDTVMEYSLPSERFPLTSQTVADGYITLISLAIDGFLDKFGVTEKYGLTTFQGDRQTVQIAHSRSQILFDDLTRANNRSHGQSYVDHRLVVGQNVTAIKGEPPNTAQVGAYTPANTVGSDGTLRLKPIGGGGFDCRSAKVYTEEKGEARPEWHQTHCVVVKGNPYSLSNYTAASNNPLKKPDGIPDTMWVNPDVLNGADGTTLDPDYLRKHRSIVHFWTDTYGAPDGVDARHPYSDKKHDDLRDAPLKLYQRGLGEYGIFDASFGIIFNREFIVNIVEENGEIVKIEHIDLRNDCSKLQDDDDDIIGGAGDDDLLDPKRFPNGHPDDYQAPWTFESSSTIPVWDLDTQYLQSILPDTALEPWSSAWSQAVVNALQPRIQQAQQLGLAEAEKYYHYMVALINYRQDSANRLKILNSAELSQEYTAATEQANDLTTQLYAELATGTRNGQPASHQAIYDYWMNRIATDSSITTWNNRPEAQAWYTSASSFINAREQFIQAREHIGNESVFQLRIFQQRTKVERAIKNLAGVGILKGGLDTWTNATMTFAGMTAQVIDPLNTSPHDVPPVLIVPTGALERYQQFEWSRGWLEQYTQSGGTLVVLAQAFGRDWELLPGGKVRGLGFEEDILCREASVDLITIQPYLAGIRKDTPDLQLDGSFTHYPANATVILQRRTGNLMPAMIEYPHGLGKVVATSIYADFAVINGMQSGDDLPFARSFFLYWWAEATGTTIEEQVPINEPFTIDVNLVNTTNTPLTKVEVSTDAVLDGPDTWRYQVHYRQRGDSPEAAAQIVNVTLDPPLAPQEQRLVNIAMPAVRSSGYHRLGVNGTPDTLYLIESPFGHASTVKLHIERDQDRYWHGEQAQLTLTLSPTEQLQINTTMTISEKNGFFTNRNVTVRPGQSSTVSINIPLIETKHLKTPFNIIVRESSTNHLQASSKIGLPAGVPLALTLNASTATTHTIPLTVRNIGLYGTAFTGNLQLTDSYGYVLLTQPISGAVGHTKQHDLLPTSQQFSMALPGNQAAGKYMLSYQLFDQVETWWSGKHHIEIPGLAAELATEIELPVYDFTQTITATTWFTPNMSIDNGWLNLTVKKTFDDMAYKLLAGGLRGTDGQGRDAHFSSPHGIAISNDGSYALVVDNETRLLRHVNMHTGEVRTLAGNMEPYNGGYGDDKFADGIGEHVYFWDVRAIALSPDESFALIIDGNVVRKFELANRRITTIAGSSVINPSQFGGYEMESGFVDGVGSEARFSSPRDIKISHDGTFAVIADGNAAIRKIDLQTYAVTTLAGGTLPWDDGHEYNDGIGAEAQFGYEIYVALTPDDQTAYIVDEAIHVIRKLNLQTQEVTTIVGAKGFSSSYVDGIGLDARLYSPYYIDIDSTGTYAYFTDSYKHTVRRLDLQTLEVTTISGDPNSSNPCSVNGNICAITGISVAGDDSHLAISAGKHGSMNQIYQLNLSTMEAQVVAGEVWTGANGVDRFDAIGGVALMPNGQSALMLGDNMLWHVDTQGGQQTLLAGGHYTTSWCQNTDGIGEAARFCNPEGLALSPDTSFALIADTGNKVIRRYDLATHEVTTVAGSGACTSSTTVDGIGTAAELCSLRDIKISADGTYAIFLDRTTYPRYIDTVRKLDLQSFEVTTIINDETSPDLYYPNGLALSPDTTFALIGISNYDYFLSLDLQTLETTVLTAEGDLDDFYFYYEESDYYSPIMDVIDNPSAIEISADGTFAIFFDGGGLKHWDFISNTISLLSTDFTTWYNGQLALSQEGSRLLFASNYGYEYGNHGAALKEAELAATLYDQWMPLSGTGAQTIINPLTYVALASDSRARGTLVLEAALYGPQRTDALTTERQLIARDASYFVITPDSYTLTVVPEPSEVRLGDPAALQGMVRNSTAQTGVTIAVSANGVALPDLVLPDVAPGEVARFSVPVDTSSPGFYNYTLATVDGTTASAEIGVFGPGIMVDPLIGDTQVHVNTTAVFTTTIENQSPLDGSVTVAFADQAPITFEVAGNTAISATFTLPISETAPRYLTLPVTFSGDLEEQRTLELEVLFTGQAQLEVDNVIVGAPVASQVMTHSLEPTLAPLAIPNNGERSLLAPIMITQPSVAQSISVQVSLVHSSTATLEISLVAPNGQEVRLLEDGYAYGENLLETTFDDQATTFIHHNVAPFTGSFRPFQSLSAFDGASLAGEWVLKVTDTSADSYAGQLLDWKLIVTPHAVDTSTPVVAGQAVQILTTLQPTKRGLTTLHIEGLEGMAQQPLAVLSFDPVMVSTLITVPSTLPGGEYPMYVEVGDVRVEIPVAVRNWEAELAMHMPVSSIQAGDIFTPEVTLTETAGLSGEPVLYVRYGTTVVTQVVTLLPNSVQTIPVSLTASNDARRVSVSLGNAPTEDDPPFVAIIDSRPINVHRFGAHVTLDQAQATSGTTLTGQLVIDGAVTQVALYEPLALEGAMIWTATEVSSTVEWDQRDHLIDLTATPTGTWDFAIGLPEDLPAGRYALPFMVDGLAQPVMLDVQGPHLTVHQTDLAGSSELLTVTMDIESTTAISLTPRLFYQDSELEVLAPAFVQFQPGRQDVVLTTSIPEWLRGVGTLEVVFVSANGNPLGGTQVQYQSQAVDILAADLLGESMTEAVTIPTTLLTSGPAILTLATSSTTILTETVDAAGYVDLSPTVFLPAGTQVLTLTLTDEATGVQAAWPLNVAFFISDESDTSDTVAPTISLDSPSGPFSATWTTPVTLTGVVSDNVAISSVSLRGQLAQINQATGVFTAVVLLEPGVTTLSALAEDASGNSAISNEVTVQVDFAPPTLSTQAPLSITEGDVVTLTFNLNQPSAFSGTVQIFSSGGTATAGIDYEPIDQLLMFAPLQTTQSITFTIPDDGIEEEPETLIITLRDATYMTIDQTSITLEIHDQIQTLEHRLFLPLVRRTP